MTTNPIPQRTTKRQPKTFILNGITPEISIKVIELNKQLNPASKISKKFNISTNIVRKILNNYYQKTPNPLQKFLSERFEKGESKGSLARLLDIPDSEIRNELNSIPEKSKPNNLTLSDNDIIKLREKLYHKGRIAKELKTAGAIIGGRLKTIYPNPNDDPFNKHIMGMRNNGMITTFIGTAMGFDTETIRRSMKDCGADPAENSARRNKRLSFIKGLKKPAKKIKKESNGHRYDKACDLYCYVVDGLSLKAISKITGYGESWISGILNKEIPKYHEMSTLRRDGSDWNCKSKKYGMLSEKYKSESDFQKTVESLLYGLGKFIDVADVNEYMKPDIVIDYKDKLFIIELKISTRKTSLAKALGQALVYRHYDYDNVVSIICVPDDCIYKNYFVDVCKVNNIFICDENKIKGLIENYS